MSHTLQRWRLPPFRPRGKITLDWRRQSVCFSVLWTFVICVAADANPATVHPAQLTLDAMLNEPVVLHIEVSGDDKLGDIDVKADGLRIQREIKKPARNRRIFVIEPDTSRVGRVSGSIAVVEKNGAALYTVPVSGEVKPYVRVSPSRLFLGSLEYGTPSDQMIEKSFRLSAAEGWKITSVDASDLAGAICELRDLDLRAKDLRLRFSEEALKAGQPFGAFICKMIRIKTNVPEQPEISIPISAMLSRNGTDRDFTTFVFKGNERWEGIWTTPNIAAAVIGPLVLTGLGYGVWLLRIHSKHIIVVRSAGVLLCLSSVVGLVYLAKTYSRGGWVAFVVGLASMIVLMKGHRWLLALALAGFAIFVAILPAGTERAVSTGLVATDLSITNRLLVWRGALEMIADNPARGVGAGRFGKIFRSYYQEPWHKPSYSTALNDYLTFAAERGLLLTLAIIAACVCLTAASVQLMRKHDDFWVAPPICGLIVLATSSSFSSIQSVREVWVISVCGIVFQLIYCARGHLGRRDYSFDRFTVRSVWRLSALAALIATFFGAGAVACADVRRLVRHTVTAIGPGSPGAGSMIAYTPRRVPLRGSVLFLPEEAQPLHVIGRQVLRALAENGWLAISFDVSPYDQEAAVTVAKFLKDSTEPLIVLTERSKARVSLEAALQIPDTFCLSLAFIEPIYSSALSECDKSSVRAHLPRRCATINVNDWDAFKRDSRNGSRQIFATLEAITSATDKAELSDRSKDALLSEFDASAPEKATR